MNLGRVTRLMLNWIQCRCSYCLLLFNTVYYLLQDRGSTVVKELCYKSEGQKVAGGLIPAGVGGFFIDIKSL